MQKKKKSVGRKTVMIESVIGKLERAFAWGCTDKEACLYARINPDTLYSYCKSKPSFSERKSLLKETPILQARKALIEGFKKHPSLALKYLERRRKDEFSLNSFALPNNSDGRLSPEQKQRIKEVLELEEIAFSES